MTEEAKAPNKTSGSESLAADGSADCRKFCFVNGHPFPCGCKIRPSPGNGKYSDVIYVELCDEHFLNGNPETDAESLGFKRVASGKWR